MITLTDFIGGMLQELTYSRTLADRAALAVANRYLQDEFLRGLPVPRMVIKEVEVDANFLVGSTTRLSAFLKEPAICQNICYQMREALETFYSSASSQAYFEATPDLKQAWDQGVPALLESFQSILTNGAATQDDLVHCLALAVENFFFTVHYTSPQSGLLDKVKAWLDLSPAAPQSDDASPPPATLRTWASTTVTSILQQTLPAPQGNETDPRPTLNILVEPREIDGPKAENMDKIRFTFLPDDRKWIAMHSDDGSKSYMLDR